MKRLIMLPSGNPLYSKWRPWSPPYQLEWMKRWIDWILEWRALKIEVGKLFPLLALTVMATQVEFVKTLPPLYNPPFLTTYAILFPSTNYHILSTNHHMEACFGNHMKTLQLYIFPCQCSVSKNGGKVRKKCWSKVAICWLITSYKLHHS